MRPKVLTVDDRQENLIALEHLMCAHDCDVLQARSATAALELLLEHEVALAILDVQMPEVDGYELARLMRGSLRTREIPIIFVTAGYVDHARVFKGYDVGAVDFLVKPIEPLILESKVRTFLRLHTQAQELAEAQRRLHAVMDAAPVGISFCHDPRCEELSGNRTAREQFGAPVGGLGDGALEPWSFDGPRFFKEGREIGREERPLQRAVAEARTVGPVELEVRSLDGRPWIAEITAAPIGDPRLGVQGGVVVTADVTERRRLAEALRASERRFRAMADSMPQLLWTAARDGTVEYYNARVAEYAGFAQRDDGTWAWEPALHPDDREAAARAWQEAVRRGGSYSCVHRVKLVDGGYRWVLSRARLVPGQGDTPARWFGTATDIHDRKLAEARLSEALAEAERAIVARDQVVSMVSHDLRSPLGVQRALLALLRNTLAAEPHAQEGTEIYLARMERQITKMERQLNELLDVARLQAGKPLTLERRQVDLLEIARTLIEEHGRAAARHRVVLRSELERLVGSWDPDRLERVLANLLSNAIKYSASGTEVVVELSRARTEAGEVAVLRVSDRGIGIPEQEREHVFEWFARGRNAEQVARGTGVGLAGARYIVEQHGGTIRVASREGEGSTFTVLLPIGSQPAERRERSVSFEDGARG